MTENFITKRLHHKCFPVNIAKFLRTSILKNICKRLLLYKIVCSRKDVWSTSVAQNWSKNHDEAKIVLFPNSFQFIVPRSVFVRATIWIDLSYLLWATHHFQGSLLKLKSGSFSTYLKGLNLFEKKLFWMKVFIFSINLVIDCNIPFQALVDSTQVIHTPRWVIQYTSYSYKMSKK